MAIAHIIALGLLVLAAPASLSAGHLATALGDASLSDRERIYREGRGHADRVLAALLNNQTRMDALQAKSDHASDIWDLFPSYYNCPSKEKLGNQPHDGGKWMCGIDTLLQQPSCVIYSFGSNGDTSWEQAMLARTTCEIHVFDPTLSDEGQRNVKAVAGIQFHDLGLGATDGTKEIWTAQALKEGTPFVSEIKTLGTIMEMLGHTWLDVLKVDIEGHEWATFQQMLTAKEQAGLVALPFTQLQVELHFLWGEFSDAANVLRIMERLTREGKLRVFNTEYNPIALEIPYSVIEYAFLQVSTHGEIIIPGLIRQRKNTPS